MKNTIKKILNLKNWDLSIKILKNNYKTVIFSKKNTQSSKKTTFSATILKVNNTIKIYKTIYYNNNTIGIITNIGFFRFI